MKKKKAKEMIRGALEEIQEIRGQNPLLKGWTVKDMKKGYSVSILDYYYFEVIFDKKIGAFLLMDRDGNIFFDANCALEIVKEIYQYLSYRIRKDIAEEWTRLQCNLQTNLGDLE